MEATQSKASQVRRYKLLNVSLERLMQALVSLDQHVEIVVHHRDVLIMPASPWPLSKQRLRGWGSLSEE
jgi:hypothetical protein